MPLQTTSASGPAPSQQAVRIDLAKLLGFESFSQLKVEIVKRGYVRAALAELSAMQPAAELPGILITARTAANVGPAPALPGTYQLNSACLISTGAATTQTASATPATNRPAAAISELKQTGRLPTITQATLTAQFAASSLSDMQTATSARQVAVRAETRPAVQQLASTQNALQQTVTTPSAAMLAARVISAGRPAAGTTLAVTTPSEAQLSTAQRTT